MEDEQEQVIEQEVEQLDVEHDARQMGWAAKEEWQGNPDDWVDAEAFLKRGREITPILRKNNERLLKKVTQLEHDLLEARQTFGEFKQYHDKTLEQQRESALAQLRAARKEAIANSDGEAFEQIESHIKQVEAFKGPGKPKEPEPVVEHPPEVKAWFKENAWYRDDIVLQDVANEVAERLRRGRPDLNGVEFLESVKTIVKERMPQKFRNPARNGPASVEGAAPRAPKGGKSYNDLPAEAKEMCDRFVRTIPKFTREEFLTNYQW